MKPIEIHYVKQFNIKRAEERIRHRNLRQFRFKSYLQSLKWQNLHSVILR